MKKLLDDIKSARWAIMIIIAYFAFFRKLFYTICPVVLMTGYPCPGCGMTRAALRLMRLDFAGAWQMHPFVYAVVILIIFFAFNRYIFKDRFIKELKILIIVTAFSMIGFYLWRMYTMYPDISPMVYYNGNCLNKFQEFIKLFSTE